MPTKWLQNGNFVNVKNACPLPLQNFNFDQKKMCSQTFFIKIKITALWFKVKNRVFFQKSSWKFSELDIQKCMSKFYLQKNFFSLTKKNHS